MKKKLQLTQVTEKNITLEEAFHNFIISKKAMKLADETIKYYEKCFRALSNYFKLDFKCADMTQQKHDEYILNYMETHNIASATVNNLLRGDRAFFNYCMEYHYMPSFTVHIPQEEVKIKETYTDEEQAILVARKDFKTFAELRNWVMTCYLLGTGNRSKTVRSIKNKDVDLENHLVNLGHTKNKISYMMPISTSLVKILREYMQIRGGSDDDYLFPSVYGTQMTKDTITSALAEYNRSRGITKTSIHLYRHTFAKNYVVNGGSDLRLQRLLGHTTLEMTRRYVNMFSTDLQQDFDERCPLEKFRDCFEPKKALIKKKR